MMGIGGDGDWDVEVGFFGVSLQIIVLYCYYFGVFWNGLDIEVVQFVVVNIFDCCGIMGVWAFCFIVFFQVVIFIDIYVGYEQ